MTAHDFKTAIAADLLANPTARPKHPLPAANLGEFARDVVVFTPSADEIGSLLHRASTDLVGLAKKEVVENVVAHNPDLLWAIARRNGYSPAKSNAEGLCRLPAAQ